MALAVWIVASSELTALARLGASWGATLYDLTDAPASDDPTPVVFVVRPGGTAGSIGDDLRRAGLIRSPAVFRLQAQLRDVSRQLAAGEYELRANMTIGEILEVLASGRTRGGQLVTLPEGWRAEEMAQHLETRGVVPAQAFLEVVAGLRPLPANAPTPRDGSLEGYLFPDSYDFGPSPTAESVAATLLQAFETRVDADLRASAARAGLSSHQLVTLASIIEREAVEPAERPRISAVFHNRLRAGMPLQADPTTQYALVPFGTLTPANSYWKRELTAADLRVDSPYNTYRTAGLPPGPICNPGLASLLAAAHPAEDPALYFVATGDGTHLFAETLEGHLQNVARAGSRR